MNAATSPMLSRWLLVNMDILINFISAIIGGLIVWIIQQAYLNKKEKRKDTFVKIAQSEKIIDKGIIYSLRPGIDVDLVKETLGKPLKIFDEDSPVFNEIVRQTTSYLYSFKNANIKVTSKDNKEVDTITIFPNDQTFDFKNYASELNLNSHKLNKARVNNELLSKSQHNFLAARHDYTFALNYAISNPLYIQITLFGSCEGDWHGYFETKDPKIFLNGVINGICISGYNEEAYYIYQYELR